MRAVGLKVLKNKLSEYVRLAAGGEVVLVTDRDRVVAELGPPGAERSPVLADAGRCWPARAAADSPQTPDCIQYSQSTKPPVCSMLSN